MKMKILRELLLLCTLSTLPSGNVADKSPFYDGTLTQNEDFSQNDNNYRLPTDVRPISYDIMLIPELKDNFTFSGIVKIKTVVERETNNVTLHAGKIDIIYVSVISYPDDSVKVSPFLPSIHSCDNVTEKCIITFADTLKKDKTILISITYNGTLSDNMIGFYRSSYYDENHNLKWLAATQFQTTHARHAFPCFDEPSFKARFTIRIAKEKNYKVLSNMKLNYSETLEPGGKVWDVFEESIAMPTYLVAFVISEFEPNENENFRVWSKPSTLYQTNYALKIGTQALELFANKFNEPYVLEKMDMVAVPDFVAGAMENWGLVTYRENQMLHDDSESSVIAQQRVASVIAHELSHMWFGNLVTPEWWSYLWLSEGFARYFQYFGTAEIEKNWKMEEQFVIEQHQSALIADGLESSLPMTRDVSSKSQVAGIGDIITYNKGASIVRMMSLLFGTENFEKALRRYIADNKVTGFGNPDSLWAAIEANIDQTNPSLNKVKTKMDTWTTKPGYPVVSVAITDNGILNFTQKRFLLRNLDNTSTDITWPVPLTFTQSKSDFNNMIPKYWLTDKTSTADYNIDPTKWFILNIQSSGFYRVNYDTRGWKNILNTLNENLDEIHVINRAAIVDDMLNLARAKYQKYDMVLDGLRYLKKENNYLPFKAAFNGLEYLNKRFTGHSLDHSFFKIYVLNLLDNIHAELRYQEKEDDDRLRILLRREINNWLCNFDEKECVTRYTNQFEKWRTDNARIKPNERTTAYCTAIRHGTSDDWEFLWKEYFNSNHATDQAVILNALGCSHDTFILEKYLNSSISNYNETRIRKHDSTTVFAAVYNSGLFGAEYVLDFVEKYHKQMEVYYGGQDTIAKILDEASQHFSTDELVNKFEGFIEKHKEDLASIQKPLKTSLRIAKYELDWYKSVSSSITRTLRQFDRDSYRLPTNIKPIEYVISVTPYFEKEDSKVDGNVTIKAKVVESTNKIILHSSNIIYDNIIVMVDKKPVVIQYNKTLDRYDQYVIYLTQELPAETKLIIEIDYTSNLDAAELRGFYKSSYVNEKGEKRWLAATHLEPVGARKMFPCFDEPAMKAEFTLKVNVHQDYEPITNTNWRKVKKVGADRQTYTFFKTPRMSTYLVALIVSDFKSNSMEKDGIEFAVYARPNAINQANYSLSVMHPLLTFFQDTYHQKYQLQRLSMAALPDFPSGAMENWGLLTYKETNMLYDKKHSPITNKQDIRNVIAHEISHQWFGNLVSPQWWKYLWLNEGFARYFQYFAPAHAYSDETMELQFVVDQVHSALSADSSKSTHPLSHDVVTPHEIRSIFDTITYAKGGSILRMIEKTYGTKVFDKALSRYLENRAFDVATPEHLYASLQAILTENGIKDDITTFLNTWTTQSGYPIVNAYVTENVIHIDQKRFFLKEQDNNDNTLWHIPITWALVENDSDFLNTSARIWLKDRDIMIRDLSNSFVIFNTQQAGYYRVNYNKDHWMKLIDYLKSGDFRTIHEINRAALIDDLMNLARADYVDYKIVISAIMYLERENNYLPWRAFFNNLPYLNNRFAGRDIEGIYKYWLTTLINRLYTRFDFEDHENDDKLTKIFRIHIRNWACKLDLPDCKYSAAKYFQQKQHSIAIPPNYRDVVYCTAMRTDKTNKNFKFLWEEYKNNNVTTDKLVILSSLACSENKDILETLLREAIAKDSAIRYQDSAKVFSNVYDASLIGVEAVMKIIQTNYDDILHKHYNDYTKIANMVSALASRLSTNNLYTQYQQLLDWLVTREPEFKNYVDSYKATAQYEFEWYERQAPIIFETLDNLFSTKVYRLPKTLDPNLYNISLTPYMEEGTFEGKVEIYMTVQKSTTLIVLNSHKLNISSIKIMRNGAEIPKLNQMELFPQQQLKIYLSAYVHTNQKIIAEIYYNGTLNDDMNGFYRSSYLDSNKNQHWLATTHFEPTYARQAFPCFDEPEFKSRFTINIQRPIHYNSQSNMPLHADIENLVYETKNEGYIWDTFHTNNVKMSTYLVAFVVSEFKSVDTSGNTTLNVWGRPEVAAYGKYAQNIGVEIIDKLEKITAIEYALPKLDLIGIPDFSMGAMENWGLATFREYGLFYNEKETTTAHEKSLITVIAHELAHMWFGNLVTCEWWDYIWLNEGFAQYFQWFISDRILPKYNFMGQFVVYELHPALSKDASLSTHPMTRFVETPEEIANIFDYVTYGKSASVLRMLFNAFDEETYISALRSYLKNRQYLTARPEDLWKSFDKFISIPIGNRNVSVEEVMSTWTDQPGYPVVNATLNGHGILTLTQERFLMNRNTSSDEFYWIPVNIFPASAVLQDITLKNKTWLGPEPERMYINPTNDWFIVNYKQTGFYRVNYDTSSWGKLIMKLKNKEFRAINVLNRAQIIDDLFNLARANYVDYELLMSATQYLKQETDHLPWKAFFNGLSYIYERFEEQQPFQKQFNGYLLSLLSEMYNKVGFDDRDDDEHLDKLNREMILQWTCKLNKADCIVKSVKLFAAWRKNITAQIPRNARPAVYCTAIKEGNEEDWNFLWNQYIESNFATEKKLIINALGCSTNKVVLKRYLEKAIEKYDSANAIIRRQDVSAVFASVYSAGPVGVNVTLDILITNINAVQQYFKKWDEIANLFINVASHISNKEQYVQLEIFVHASKNSIPPNIYEKLQSAVTTANTNLLWFDNNNYKIRNWIMSLKPENKPDSSTRIESLNIVLTTLIALISYLLSYY